MLQGTVVLGIDTAGDVTGTYVDPKGVAHGFERAAGGKISTFNALDAGTAPGPNKNLTGSPYFQGTIPIGINTGEEITGTYIDGNYNYHGFVRTAADQITPFDVTGDIIVSPWEQAMGTRPIGINAAGEVAGTYMDPNYNYHGFFRAANGQITPFDALTPNTGIYTIPIGIDTAGDIAGTYADGNGFHGFIRAAGGKITPFDVKGAGGNANDWEMVGTVALGIDAGGDVVGTYTDAGATTYANAVRHAFVRSAKGVVSSFDAPGAGAVTLMNVGGELAGTAGVAINTAGEIAGAYLDADAVYHGFVRAVNGSITTFDAPGAGDGPLQGTVAFSINDAGAVAGTYLDASYVAHGFVLTAALTPTTTLLGSSPNPSRYKEPVTFTAKITSAAGAPPNGEDVYFMDGATELGTAALSGGTATFTTTALPVGKDPITAVYGGNVTSGFAGSSSSTLSQTVGKADSYATLTSKPKPSAFGQPVTFTATVTGQYGGTPTGSVTFNDGKTALKTVSLSKGAASFTTTALSVGSHSITAVYTGDSNFAGSTSDAVSQVVGKASSTTALDSSKNPSVFGQPVTFTAKVSGLYGGTATGTVTFNHGSTKLGSVTLSKGAASLTTGALAVGSSSISAVYGGDSNFAGSTSGAVTQAVDKASTMTALTSSVNPSNSRQMVTFTAVVVAQYGVTATGSVTFKDGTTALKTVSLSGGAAKLTTSTLAAGMHSVTAVYSGSTDLTGSSGFTTQTVN
jgi:hypothetical protein